MEEGTWRAIQKEVAVKDMLKKACTALRRDIGQIFFKDNVVLLSVQRQLGRFNAGMQFSL